MDDGLRITLYLVLAVLLVGLNGFFVAVEFALVRVKESRLSELTRVGNTRAKVAQHVSSRLDAYLSASQLGITVASLALGWIGGPAISRYVIEPIMSYFQAPSSFIVPISFVVAFGIIVSMHMVLGELVPKAIAISKPERTSMWLSAPLVWFYRITYPCIWILNKTANTFVGWLGLQPINKYQAGHTEEEIRILIKESQKSGHIDENELLLVENIFNFTERQVQDVMIPRTMIECLYANNSFADNMKIVMSNRYARFPVAVENKDDIIGFVRSTDMYKAAIYQNAENINSLIRPISRVTESMEVSQVLRNMQREHMKMSIVLDDYGGTAGLITMEDLLEEIVGEIQDGQYFERPEVDFFDSYTTVDGRFLLEKVNALFNLDIDDDEVNTIGGWIYSQLTEQPQLGMKVTYNEIDFIILELDNLRINRVRINALPINDDASDNEVAVS